jgi:Asparagine synthase
VISHLGLSNWERIELADEVDFVGPLAKRALSRLGVLYPANAFFHLPILDLAAGGVLLTGHPGDSIFGCSAWFPLWSLARGARRPVPHDALLVAKLFAPPVVRRLRVEVDLSRPWLTPEAAEAAVAPLAREVASEPASWTRRVAWAASRRRLALASASLEAIAAMAGADIQHPLLDPGFLAVLARRGGFRGFASRTALMREVFSGLLPAEVLERRDKATFDDAFVTHHSRELIERWSGGGVDPELVDEDALRRHLLEHGPDMHTAMLLQSIWLSTKSRQEGLTRHPREREDRPIRRRVRAVAVEGG